MKILQVHKYLYPRDGASTYLFGLAELLTVHGHELMLWGPDKALNFDRREGIVKDFIKFFNMMWSVANARKFERVVGEFKPDVIHIHNIYHHISPSILAVSRRLRIPVVMTVHDYHLINPNYILYDHGAICERNGLRAIAHRCIKNSFAATAADVIEWNVHRWMKIYEKNIARFIVPTEFVKRKLVEGGIPKQKIACVSLPVILNEAKRSEESLTNVSSHTREIPRFARNDKKSDYVLFAGRLAEEKGVYAVLEIAKHLPDIKFKIAGSGPEEKNLQLLITNYQLQNVELLGFQNKDALQHLIYDATLILVPSLWYDPSPFAVLEAMGAGKAVVASKIGGIPELIEDKKTGFLLPPADASQWVDKITKICYDAELLNRIGAAARLFIQSAHDPETHYEKIMEIYRATGN